MSTDFSIRPVGAPAPSPVPPPVNQAAGNAVATQLPGRQSVTAADASAGIRNDSPQPGSDIVSHQAFFDREAASIVFQAIDEKTDEVVDQYPDEAVLRRRAYFHALDLAKSAGQRAIPTDVTA